jgi:hypothetical protein
MVPNGTYGPPSPTAQTGLRHSEPSSKPVLRVSLSVASAIAQWI